MEKLNMALQFRKPVEPAARVSPHRAALKDNLKAITDARAKVNLIHERDRAAVADIALGASAAQRVKTLEDAIDQARADAKYHGRPEPDTSSQERELSDARERAARLEQSAREAGHLHARYTADIASLQDLIRAYARETTRLLWVALREDCLASLAAEYLEKEAAFLEVRKRAFSAALAADVIAMSQAYGQFCGSGDASTFNIPRPDHPSYHPVVLTPEQSYAERNRYAQEIAAGEKALLDELLNQ
jgi:hypothetical protein